jgi:hypothetical protein
VSLDRQSDERALPQGGARSFAARKPSMVTWQCDRPARLESVRLLVSDSRLRASGRIIAAADEADGSSEAFSASFEASVEGDTAGRLLLRTTTAEDERQISLSRTEDGVWLVDRDGVSRRDEFDGSVTVAVAGAITFHALPIRRLGLHRVAGEAEIPVVFVALPDLAVSLVQATYRTVSITDDGAVIEFTGGGTTSTLTVDSDGIVVEHQGIGRRV